MKKIVFFTILVSILSINPGNGQDGQSSSQNRALETVKIPKNFDLVAYYKKKGIDVFIENGFSRVRINDNMKIKNDDCRYFRLLKNITHIYLYGKGNQLSNECLKYLGDTKYLEYITIKDANIDDEGLKYYADTSRIEDIQLIHVKVNGSGFKFPRNNSNLKSVWFYNNDRIGYFNKCFIADENLQYLSVFTNLNELDLSYSNITGSGLKYLKPLKKLKFLGLANTKMNDEGMRSLSGITSENISIDLTNTGITDRGLKYLENNTNIYSLFLPGTKTTEACRKYLENKLPIWMTPPEG